MNRAESWFRCLAWSASISQREESDMSKAASKKSNVRVVGRKVSSKAARKTVVRKATSRVRTTSSAMKAIR